MTRNKLYIILATACLAGYGWIALAYHNAHFTSATGACLFKHATSIPCPSCGSTRAVLMLLHGDILQSVFLNPFGLLIAGVLVIAPVWILYDLLTKKNALLHTYHFLENLLKQKRYALPAIALVLANWIWNICKNL